MNNENEALFGSGHVYDGHDGARVTP